MSSVKSTTVRVFLFLLSIQAAALDDVPTYFSKKLDAAVLKKTFNLTPGELLNFVESEGAQVLLLDLSNVKNSTSPHLASQETHNRWVKDFSDNKIAGKFFSELEVSEFSKPTILITDLSDKWTLLHEFMHFLFTKKRSELHIDDNVLLERQRNAREDYLNSAALLRQSVSDRSLQQSIDAFAEFVDAELQLAELLSLEEIVIEKTISILYSQGKIKHLSLPQKHTADHYIEGNHSTLNGQLSSFFEIHNDLQKYLGSEKHPVLEKTFFKLTIFKSELVKLMDSRSPASSEKYDPSIDSICGRFYKIFPTPEPSMQAKCQVQGDTLYWDGEINDYLINEIRDYHKNIKLLELNSYGGLLESAFEVAAYVRNAGIGTNVRKGARCASACTLIYQAGVRRTAYPTTRFLYHAPRIMESGIQNWKEYCQLKGRDLCRKNIADHIFSTIADADRMFTAYLSYDLSPKFIEEYKSLPIDPRWFENGNFTRTKDRILSAAQLVKYNVVQDLDLRETL